MSKPNQFTKTFYNLVNEANKLQYRNTKNQLYSTLEDFTRMNPNLKRIIVISGTGSGKSTLLNILGGWKLLQNKTNSSRQWSSEPLFLAGDQTTSMTQKTVFANLNWLGDINKSFIGIDTPGVDDTEGAFIDDLDSRNKISEISVDLHNKLKAIGYIDAILVLHNDVHSNRLNPLTKLLLKMLVEQFNNIDIWNNIIIAYTKCNEFDFSWRNNLDNKKLAIQDSIKSLFPTCQINIPIIALGGIQLNELELTKDEKLCVIKPDTKKDLRFLYKFIQETKPINTKVIKVFKGPYQKYESIINKNDLLEAKLDARKQFNTIIFQFIILYLLLIIRSLIIPSFLSPLFLDFEGLYDEIIIVSLVIQCIGWTKTVLVSKLVYTDYIQPKLAKLKRN
jgi:energy-coupling factor transporter ATP-binding protein EcfA2